MRRHILAGGLAGSLLALVLIAGTADPSSAGTFNPTLEVQVTTPDPEVPSEFIADFGIPEGDVNFAGVVTFVPKDWGIIPGDKIPIGTKVGDLSSDAILGLLNAACNTLIPVEFEFQNASLDTSDTVSFLDTDKNVKPDFAEDKNSDGNMDAVDKYPEFLNRLFAEADQPPIRRAAGITPVAGIAVLLQFLLFPPGTVIRDFIPSDPELGYPSVTVLQNIGDEEAEPMPGAITYFCSPLTAHNVTAGAAEDGSQDFFVNPQNGTYTFTAISFGQRDADDDGYENSLDTCVLVANTGNPRVPNDGDADGDGLDAACDPNDNKLNSDEDLDGYQNRQDNCPLEPNGQDLDNQNDADLDQIGDACDQNPDTADGELIEARNPVDIKIGDGTGPGGPPSEAACPDCYRLGEEPADEQPTTTDGEGDDGGLSTGALIGIIAAVAAGVVVVGGGAFLLLRRS